ncbi:hypothetical protein J21TS7_40750 [Paenibacillus cineris]|uniref:Uncharacterized protein n=1 Tax=Paenibacillus cineris TaxID=237530 RepID=A0ABQ4LH38_9BACL|nr:hypothetical protein J21TS7_40750 [Paenibacillus cineris]
MQAANLSGTRNRRGTRLWRELFGHPRGTRRTMPHKLSGTRDREKVLTPFLLSFFLSNSSQSASKIANGERRTK